MESIVERLKRLDTASLSDAMWKQNAMDSAIKPLSLGVQMIGQALTVRTVPSDFMTVIASLDSVRPGHVIVIDASRVTESAVLGELVCYEAARLGAVGIVLDGAARDAAAIRKSGFPVFARSIIPRCGSCDVMGEIQVPINCGGVNVKPDDWIVGDDDGVVVIPQEKVDLVLRICESVEDMEDRIKGGERIKQVFGLEKYVQERARIAEETRSGKRLPIT
ncbi:MAG: RraA family protein [candidate division NC10 bacterium]|nr:RraA family protein [candidate division NC10 bacterium]